MTVASSTGTPAVGVRLRGDLWRRDGPDAALPATHGSAHQGQISMRYPQHCASPTKLDTTPANAARLTDQ
ncbi:hypothetical protein FRAAL0972 [Frankia alni ACN14a]|uniref:Uncharacterized protein n=1 Tax=Frankia alni (strain DSM 45986 / CECT 9034 / ACN14a) TaxID=326424 RepID=Q0RS28_FRAAA|nr:hypothetical protein FRAAL0972 [Frankia alni ACN14a]